MITRDMIVEETLSWLNTPYAHYQCCKSAGCDCIHLIAGISLQLGILNNLNIPYYSPQWHVNQKEELLLNSVRDLGCVERGMSELLPGDFILFRFLKNHPCSHAAVLIDNRFIVHALAKEKRVVRTRFAHDWKIKWAAHYFSYPGVA